MVEDMGMSTETIVKLIGLVESGICQLESAERETNWGDPLFGPSPSEELKAELEALHEDLAVLFIQLSGKKVHASDCATSCSPAFMPGPCDCEIVS